MHRFFNPRRPHLTCAFTLIELSIVLLIIGLITAGILVGQTMVRQSQINSAMTDVQQFVKAAQAFRDKYAALPGDMPNATSYWGATATPSPTNCINVAGTGTQTCDGDGNGQIGAGTSGYEQLLVWQHLANAQLIQGTYTGVGNTNGAVDNLPGSNVPKSRIEGAGYGLIWIGTQVGATSYFDNVYNHVIILGAHSTGTLPATATMTTQEALAFDAKYDDGLPATGSISVFKPATLANCATTSVSSTAAYKIASTGMQCSLIFITGF